MNNFGYLDLRFADETGFSMLPNVPYGWLPKGKQTGILADNKRVLNVFGLMSLNQDLSSYPTTKTIDSRFIIKCIDDFAATRTKTTVIVLDQAPWHRAASIQGKIKEWEKKNLFLFYLPSYSPHLNAIEILWRRIKYKWLKPKDFLSPSTLKQAVFNLLENFGDQFCINFSMNFYLLQ